VVVRGLVKRYPLFARRRDRALALFGWTGGLAHKTALDGIELEAFPGEAVGIIGENGSGKSTLLRVVAGISPADAGEIRVKAPVAAILELGLGFHPEFTGRENAVLYGALLGVPERIMAERLDEVLAFADLGEYVDQPLRTYSSGMAARLAFAVAIHVDPAVLVVDEVLAVGDGAFQKKCIDAMIRFKQEGRTVLFCSHALYAVMTFCQRALWLHEGRVRLQGSVHEVVGAYETYLLQREKRQLTANGGVIAGARVGGGAGHFRRVRVLDARGDAAAFLVAGEGCEIELAVESAKPETVFHAAVTIESQDGRCLFAASTARDGVAPLCDRTSYLVHLRIPSLPIAAGSFLVWAHLFDENALHIYDEVVAPEPLEVKSDLWTPSLLQLPHHWDVGANS
jgi:lipopolysaccharide transport system ATP-binding protein